MNISVLKCIFAIIICHAPGSVDLHRAIIICHAPGSVDLHRARPLKNKLSDIVVNSYKIEHEHQRTEMYLCHYNLPRTGLG